MTTRASFWLEAFEGEMAAKKRVKFEGIPEQDSDDDAAAVSAPATKKARRFKDKHSLDSDEEDKADDVGQQLGDEDLAHQEEATIDWDGDTRVTPFNLKEEMEEGRFDSHGNYYPGKEEDDVADQWLESVDWDRVRETEPDDPSKEPMDDSSDDEDLLSSDEKNALLRKAVDILQPGETVAGALRRLGGGGSRAGGRRQAGKVKKASEKEADVDSAEVERKKRLLLELTETADRLLQNGQMSIYSDTYEKLRFELLGEKKTTSGEAQSSSMAQALEADFADSPTDGAAEQSSSDTAVATATGAVAPEDSDEVCWVYKWTDSDDAEVHGPFTSTQMNHWSESGCFPDGVFVQKSKDKDGAFYTSKRIDFDLYID